MHFKKITLHYIYYIYFLTALIHKQYYHICYALTHTNKHTYILTTSVVWLSLQNIHCVNPLKHTQANNLKQLIPRAFWGARAQCWLSTAAWKAFWESNPQWALKRASRCRLLPRHLHINTHTHKPTWCHYLLQLPHNLNTAQQDTHLQRSALRWAQAGFDEKWEMGLTIRRLQVTESNSKGREMLALRLTRVQTQMGMQGIGCSQVECHHLFMLFDSCKLWSRENS